MPKFQLCRKKIVKASTQMKKITRAFRTIWFVLVLITEELMLVMATLVVHWCVPEKIIQVWFRKLKKKHISTKNSFLTEKHIFDPKLHFRPKTHFRPEHILTRTTFLAPNHIFDQNHSFWPQTTFLTQNHIFHQNYIFDHK